MVTKDDIQKHMGRSDVPFSTEEGTVIDRLIGAVSSAAEGYCYKVFRSGSMTERVTNYGTTFIEPTGYPIKSVEEIKFITSDGTYSSSEIETDDKNIYLLRGREWPKGKYHLEYTYGWDTSDVPDDMKLAVINEVISQFNLQRSEPRPTENISAWEREMTLTAKFKEYLNRYVKA